MVVLMIYPGRWLFHWGEKVQELLNTTVAEVLFSLIILKTGSSRRFNVPTETSMKQGFQWGYYNIPSLTSWKLSLVALGLSDFFKRNLQSNNFSLVQFTKILLTSFLGIPILWWVIFVFLLGVLKTWGSYSYIICGYQNVP